MPSHDNCHVTISLIFRRLGFSLVLQFPATEARPRSSFADIIGYFFLTLLHASISENLKFLVETGKIVYRDSQGG